MGPKNVLGGEIWDPFAYYGKRPNRDADGRKARAGAVSTGAPGDLTGVPSFLASLLP